MKGGGGVTDLRTKVTPTCHDNGEKLYGVQADLLVSGCGETVMREGGCAR